MTILKKTGSAVFIYIVMIFTIVISVYPILWVIMSAFKTNAQILGNPFTLPTAFHLAPFISVYTQYNFLVYTLNSFLVASVSTLIALIIYAMGAYVIAKYDFPGKNLFFVLFTLTLLVPGHSKAQPIFSMILALNLYDTKQALILVYLSGGMAMSMFVLKSAFQVIPSEFNEAAAIEGAGFFRIFSTINLPLARSGLATAGVLMFLGNWNEYFYAMLLTSSKANRTLPLALGFFTEAFSYDYTKMFAALVMAVMPGIVIYMFVSEQVQASVASSGVKG